MPQSRATHVSVGLTPTPAVLFFFFFNDTAPPEIYPLPLHDALPIWEWGLELGEPFAFSYVSYVAPAGAAVIKVAWDGDTESLHEGDALELWDGDGAVRLLRRSGRALLEERAVPGNDLSALPEAQATAIAVDLASRLWRRAGSPFRPVAPEVSRWLDEADRKGGELVPLARKLLAELDPGADWLVHGDLHHHNILRRGDQF